MDGVMFGLIIFLAIAGPTLLALALYWWRNPDRRLSWRRALEPSEPHGRIISSDPNFVLRADEDGVGFVQCDDGVLVVPLMMTATCCWRSSVRRP